MFLGFHRRRRVFISEAIQSPSIHVLFIAVTPSRSIIYLNKFHTAGTFVVTLYFIVCKLRPAWSPLAFVKNACSGYSSHLFVFRADQAWTTLVGWLVGCGLILTSHWAVFQLNSDGTVVQFPNLDLLTGTQRHGHLGVFSVPSLLRHGYRAHGQRAKYGFLLLPITS